jgi:hypothetical protein
VDWHSYLSHHVREASSAIGPRSKKNISLVHVSERLLVPFYYSFIILLTMHACKHNGYICTIQILVKGQLGKQHYRYNKFSSGLFAKQMRMTWALFDILVETPLTNILVPVLGDINSSVPVGIGKNFKTPRRVWTIKWVMAAARRSQWPQP